MTDKKNVKDLIQKEETHLNNLLEQKILLILKVWLMSLETLGLKNKCLEQKLKQDFLYLQDNRYPTKAAKYWQCVREQSSYLDNLMTLSFDYRRNEAKIKWLEKK